MAELEKNGIAVADIGEVAPGQAGIEAADQGAPVAWPRFDGDEITKLFG
jgi:hypothetical protein